LQFSLSKNGDFLSGLLITFKTHINDVSAPASIN